MAVYDSTHFVRLLRTDSGQELARLEDSNLEVPKSICFTQDGTRLVTASNGKAGGIHVWDLTALRMRLKEMELDWDAPDYPPIHNADGPFKLAVLGADGFVRAARAYHSLRQEQLEAAAAELEQAIELLPQLDWACNELAQLHVLGPKSRRNVEKAVALAEHAIRLCPCDVTYKFTLGVAYYRASRWQEARDTLEASTRDSPGYQLAEHLFFLAMCHHRLGDVGKAKDCYDRAVKWVETRRNLLPSQWVAELREIRTEVDAVFAVPERSKP
jgi:tetratricopeptide (TPR) repeat protein